MDEMFADISVVIPTCNPGLSLLTCITSLQRLDYPSDKIEIIVLDVCSTENVEAMVKLFFPKCKVIKREEKSSCFLSKNDGASGKIIAYIGSNCVANRNWARRINKNITDGSIAVTGPILHSPDMLSQLVAITQFGCAQSRRASYTRILPVCNSATTKETLEEFVSECKNATPNLMEKMFARHILDSEQRIAYDPQMSVLRKPDLTIQAIMDSWLDPSQAAKRLYAAKTLNLTRFPSPAIIATARLWRDYHRLISLTISKQIPVYLLPALAASFPISRVLDAIGMSKSCKKSHI